MDRDVGVRVCSLPARHLLPSPHANLRALDWGERVAPHLRVDITAREIVHDDHVMTLRIKSER